MPPHLDGPTLSRHIINGLKDHAERHKQRADKFERHNTQLKDHMEQARKRAVADHQKIKALKAKLKAAGIESE